MIDRENFESRNSARRLTHLGIVREYRVCGVKRKAPVLFVWAVVLSVLVGALWENGAAMTESRLGLLGVLLTAAAVICGTILVFPPNKGETLDRLRRAGVVNCADETPSLIRRERDRQFPEMSVWIFDSVGIPLSAWQEKQPSIEAAMDVAVVDISDHVGKSVICMRTVPAQGALPEYIPWDMTRLSPENFVLTLGWGYAGPVTVNLAVIPHILLGGSTGSGKSVLLKLLLAQAAEKGAEIVIADFKGGVDFGSYWTERCEVCTDEDRLASLLAELLTELERRKKLLREAGCPNIDTYFHKTGCLLPRRIFACDEVAEILDKTGAEPERKKRLAQIEGRLSTIARQGRAFGIHLILATQRPDAAILPGQIKNNMDCRICGRADNVLSQIILDSTAAADEIPKNARGRFITGDGTVFQAFWFEEA